MTQDRRLATIETVGEGVVWHRNDGARLAELSGRSCFKVINNTYLRKQK